MKYVPADKPISEKIEVKIDSKTTIYVDHPDDVEAARARYTDHIKDPAKEFREKQQRSREDYHAKDGIKKCNKCFRDKALQDFTKQKQRPDGVEDMCKACKRKLRDGGKEFKDSIPDMDLNNAEKVIIDHSVKAGLDLFPYCPIIVDQGMNIIDGQHRFAASKYLQLPVHYVMADTVSIFQIAMMNSATDKWKEKDFLKCYLGISDYAELKKYHQDTGISLGILITMLSGGVTKSGSSTAVKQAFQKGKFKINHREFTDEMIALSAKMEPYMDGGTSRSILHALNVVRKHENFDLATMIDKCKRSQIPILKQASHKDVLDQLEKIYNWKNSVRKSIY